MSHLKGRKKDRWYIRNRIPASRKKKFILPVAILICTFIVPWATTDGGLVTVYSDRKDFASLRSDSSYSHWTWRLKHKMNTCSVSTCTRQGRAVNVSAYANLKFVSACFYPQLVKRIFRRKRVAIWLSTYYSWNVIVGATQKTTVHTCSHTHKLIIGG